MPFGGRVRDTYQDMFPEENRGHQCLSAGGLEIHDPDPEELKEIIRSSMPFGGRVRDTLTIRSEKHRHLLGHQCLSAGGLEIPVAPPEIIEEDVVSSMPFGGRVRDTNTPVQVSAKIGTGVINAFRREG